MKIVKFRQFVEGKFKYSGMGKFGFTAPNPNFDIYPLEQYINRQDLNGVDFYEGSIIRLAYDYASYIDEGDSGYYIGVIKYVPSKGFIMDKVKRFSDYIEDVKKPFVREKDYRHFSASFSEIIGSIHTTPELLT